MLRTGVPVRLALRETGTLPGMESEHIDRQPPRDAGEEAEQEELMRGGAAEAATELPTSAPAEDVDPPEGSEQ